MVSRKPSLIIPSLVAPSGCVQVARLGSSPSAFSYISFFRSLLLDMQISSPSIKVIKHAGIETSHSQPVFGDQDKIEGKVTLDPSCSQAGRLTISLEGTFECLPVEDVADSCPYKQTIRKHRHVFLSSSTSISMSSIFDTRSAIRDALSIRRRQSSSALNSSAHRSCEFSFELPRGSRPSEELPSTFSSRIEGLEIAYRIIAVWEVPDGSANRAILEAPVLFQPDTDFQSLDGFAMMPKSWLERPLLPERPVPFNCAVTFPRCQSFSRCTSIPYFVVFSTNTRSPRLVQEIASDATVAVSLVRKITTTLQHASTSQSSRPGSPASDESDSQASSFAPRSKLLRFSVKTPVRSQVDSFPVHKLPLEVFSTSRTLQTQVSIGFPKRPRANGDPRNLPDGLYKGKVQLSKDMLPSVDWPGISVKYYLDVSVLVGQDGARTSVPIQIH